MEHPPQYQLQRLPVGIHDLQSPGPGGQPQTGMMLRLLWSQRHLCQLYRLRLLQCMTGRQTKLTEPVVIHMLCDPAPCTPFLDRQPAFLPLLHHPTPVLQLELPLYFTDLHLLHLHLYFLEKLEFKFFQVRTIVAQIGYR